MNSQGDIPKKNQYIQRVGDGRRGVVKAAVAGVFFFLEKAT
jgi:hypothetical protein